jgi:hypothetical protein
MKFILESIIQTINYQLWQGGHFPLTRTGLKSHDINHVYFTKNPLQISICLIILYGCNSEC